MRRSSRQEAVADSKSEFRARIRAKLSDPRLKSVRRAAYCFYIPYIFSHKLSRFLPSHSDLFRMHLIAAVKLFKK